MATSTPRLVQELQSLDAFCRREGATRLVRFLAALIEIRKTPRKRLRAWHRGRWDKRRHV